MVLYSQDKGRENKEKQNLPEETTLRNRDKDSLKHQKQHFQPIEFFGGETGFKQLKIRDAEKFKLSQKNRVKLIYINYWEEVNEKLIQTRVKEALREK